MNLKSQVCALEYAKRLKELGVKQDSYYCYGTKPDIDNFCHLDDKLELMTLNRNVLYCGGKRESCYISAFTPSELFELLPKEIDSEHKNYPYELNIKWELHYSDSKMWHITYIRYNDNDKMDFVIYDKNINGCLAKMLIHLLQNGLIKNESHNNTD